MKSKKNVDVPVNLDNLFKEKFGAGATQLGSEILDDHVEVSTGSIMLDSALGKPLAPGITEIAGQYGAGKTTIALEICSNAQKAGLSTYYINMERSLNQSILKCIKGLDLSKLDTKKPQNGEEACDMIEFLVRSTENSLIVVDSVAAMAASEKLAEESASQDVMGLLARLLSKWLPKAVVLTKDRNCRLLLINQLRSNIGGYGAPAITPGGAAIPYYSNERIMLRFSKSKDLILDDNKMPAGITTHAEVIKTRFAPPFRTADVPIVFGKGIDRNMEAAQTAVNFGLASKEGAWFKYKEEKCHGIEKLSDFIGENPKEYNEIRKYVMELTQ